MRNLTFGRFFPAVVICASLLGCSHQPKPGESIVEACAPANADKKVSVSGVLAMPSMISFCGDTCNFRLAKSSSEEKPYVSISFRVGQGNATMKELPKKFTQADVDIQDSNGKHIHVGDAVRLTGTLKLSPTSDCAMYSPETIEAQ